jgi:thioredoxin reductase (NADPH)
MRQQLDTVFSRMKKRLRLKLYLDSRPISVELENFITALGALTDQLFVEVSDRQTSESVAPCVKVCLEDGKDTGLAFHGVPSGHEFTSFVLGLYNAAGPGQPLDRDTKRRIAALKTPTELKILVTLSCTMCPELVAAAQRIAAENPNVTAHVYDLRHFEELKDRYKVMSVPCMVINNEKVSFGKKNVEQVLELLSAQTG